MKSKAGIKPSGADSGQTLQEVTKMLEERSQEAQDRGAEASPKSKASMRFISEKHTGSINCADARVTGKFLFWKFEIRLSNPIKLWMRR